MNNPADMIPSAENVVKLQSLINKDRLPSPINKDRFIVILYREEIPKSGSKIETLKGKD